jgi:ubiquinone/menaquinone biosynthesis C-methylase UbiE
MSNNEPSDVAQRKQKVSGTFSQVAVTYDRVGPRFFSHFGRRLVALAQIPSGAHVLDAATGRGAVLFPAAACVGPRGHVVGIDLAEAMVSETAQELTSLGVPNAEVRHMDAEDLQFPDAVFDCVLCGFAIFFFAQPYRTLSEFRRVLKPDGRIGMTTFDESFYAQWEWFDELVDAYLPPPPEVNQPPQSPSPPQPEFDKPEGLEALMTATGFTRIQVTLEAREFVYADEEEFWSKQWSLGSRAKLEKIEEARGPEGLLRLQADVFEGLQALKQADGIHQLFPVLFTLASRPRA